MLYQIKDLIPKNFKENIVYQTVRDLFFFIRTQKTITGLLGPYYERSIDLIEIDITYSCNLSSFSCDRSCGHAPTA